MSRKTMIGLPLCGVLVAMLSGCLECLLVLSPDGQKTVVALGHYEMVAGLAGDCRSAGPVLVAIDRQGKCLGRSYDGDEKIIDYSPVFSPDSSTVAFYRLWYPAKAATNQADAAGDEPTTVEIRLWDLTTGRQRTLHLYKSRLAEAEIRYSAVPGGQRWPQFSPDGKSLLVQRFEVDADKLQAYALSINLADGQARRIGQECFWPSFVDGGRKVVAFVAVDEFFASLSRREQPEATSQPDLQPESRSVVLVQYDTATGKELSKKTIGQIDQIEQITMVLTTTSRDGVILQTPRREILAFDPADQSLRTLWRNPPNAHVVFSPDGRWVLVGGLIAANPKNNMPALLLATQPDQPDAAAAPAELPPDSKFAIPNLPDDADRADIWLLDRDSGQWSPVCKFAENVEMVQELNISADGRTAAFTEKRKDGEIHLVIIDLPSGRRVLDQPLTVDSVFTVTTQPGQ